ncbi:MAG: FlgD immunoglobulin-like domain containing protein [Candidatus Cloacimonetes bacterium]|jgi:hypothetical protein|nr:FlgD immunoglobulin-like domain containing protein [Candidatus Cloacimonadota bacterium]
MITKNDRWWHVDLSRSTNGKSALCFLLVFCLSATCLAYTIHVDINSMSNNPNGSIENPFPSIRAALLVAEEDRDVDTILIYPGTYFENLLLDHFGQELTLRSTFEPEMGNTEVIEQTMISGGLGISEPTIQIYYCDAPIHIWGLSIVEGTGKMREPGNPRNNWSSGGGIYAAGDHAIEQYVSVKWCDIFKNYAFWGGGIYGEYTNYTIEDTKIHDNALYFIGDEYPPDSHDPDNHLNGPRGAGIYIAGGASEITRCNIFNNYSFMYEGHPLFNRNCLGNAAALVWRHNCSGGMIGITIDSCEIYDNVTKISDRDMEPCEWPYRSTIMFQRAGTWVDQPGAGSNYVEMTNNRIMDNKIIYSSEPWGVRYANTAVGVSRHLRTEHLDNCFVGNTVHGNTAGPDLSHQSTAGVVPFYGGYYTTLGFWVPVSINVRSGGMGDTIDMTDGRGYGNDALLGSTTLLQQNYPNPFNPNTTISYDIPEDGTVRLDIYNTKGQIVKTLVNTHQSLGYHKATWDGKDSKGQVCTSGIYYYELTNNSERTIKKMLLMK